MTARQAPTSSFPTNSSNYNGGICVYSDAPRFRAGNLTHDYSDRTDIIRFLDGGNANCSKRVEITLTDVHLEWNDLYGSSFGCTGKIKGIKEISLNM